MRRQKSYMKHMFITKICFYLLAGWTFLSQIGMVHSEENPVLIGATVSIDGAYKEPSEMIEKAYRFWVDEINEKGGLLGRQVKLILYNDKSDPTTTKSLYKKLINEDRAAIVLSPYSSPLAIAASEVTEPNQKLLLAVAAAAEKPWQRNMRYLFQLYAPAKRQFIGVLDIMAKNRLKSLALIYNNQSVFNLDIVEGIKHWASIYKLKVVYERSYQDGKKDLPGMLKQIKEVNPKAIINTSYPPDSYELLALLKSMQYKPQVLSMPIVPAHPDFQLKVGDIANGVMGPSQWEPEDRIHFPGTRKFIREFLSYSGHMPSFHATSAYAACQLIEQAVNHTNSLDNTKLRNYIASLDTVTVLGRFKVDPSGRQVGHNSFIIQWQAGKKEIIWPKKIQTAPPKI